MKKIMMFGALTYSLLSAQSLAGVMYDLTPRWSWSDNEYVAWNSPCPNNGYYTSNYSTYVCTVGVNLNYGDSIVAGPYVSQLYLDRYSSFGGNNTIGSSNRNLSLNLDRNSFSARNLYIYGSIDNGGYINLTDATVSRFIRSSNNDVVFDNVNVGESVIAQKHINGANSDVGGYVDSYAGGVTLNNVDVGSYIEARDQIKTTNGDVGGHISSSHGGIQAVSNSTHLISGYVSAQESIKVTNYRINQYIFSEDYVQLNNTNVNGDVTSRSSGNPAVEVLNNSSVSGDITAKGFIRVSDSSVSGDIDNTQGRNQSMAINSSQIGGDIAAKGYVDVQSSQVSGTVSSANEGGRIEHSKVKGDVNVKEYLHVINNSYICGEASSSGDGANINNSFVGDDVSTKKYLHVTNASVFGTVSTKNTGMALSGAKILADMKAVGFPSNKYVSISNNSTLCGQLNSSYYYNGNLVAFCGLNDPSCNSSQSKGECPVNVSSGSGYDDFYEFCGTTPPDPDPDPEPTQCNLLPMEDFNANDISNWSVIGFGQSIKPTPSGGRFVLNSSQRNQATASAYNYLFPSKDNYLEVEFDHYAHSGSGADGVALVLSDANVPPQTGAFGGPLGYGVKPNIQGFAGGWLGFGIDEYGNYSREGSFDDSPNRPSRPNAVAIRGSGIKNNSGHWMGGYRYIKGNNNVGDLDNRTNLKHRYKVIIDSKEQGKVYITIQRKIGSANSWTTLISKFDVMRGFGQSTPPENFRVSITASTGDITNVHEMDNFQVCADKYQKITEGIHHFEFDYAGTGSICQASEVTLRACMDASCSKTYPSSVLSSNPGATVDPVTVSLLPQSDSLVAWEGDDRVTFSDSVSLKLQAFQSGSAKLGIASSSVPQFGFDGAKCRIAGGPLSEQNCNIVFNSAALGVTVPDKVAGKPFFNTKGQAQYSNQSSPYLEFCSSPSQQGGDGENRDVQLSIERIEPTSNAVSVPAYVSFKKRDGTFSNEVTVGTNTVEVADVYFNKQGKAYFNLKYPEAGKVALKAKIKDEKDSLGQNSFVSFPAYLKLTVDGGLCGSGSCSQKLVAAGEEFTMKVTAYQFGDDKKPAQNYQQSGLTISHKVSYPKFDSAIAGTLGTTTYDHIKLTNGTGSVTQTVSEVGAFDFTITPPETYLGSKAFTITPAEENIGRFYPKYFRVDEAKGNQWAYSHKENFAYMGQGFGVEEFYVEALNAGKGALTNYAFFSSGLQAKFGLKDTSSYQSRFILNKTYTGIWVNNGAAYVSSRSLGRFTGSTTDGLELLKGSGTSYPDGPLNFKENVKDTVISIKAAENTDPVSIDGSEGVLPTQPDIRFGRVDLDDVGGNQGTILRVPLRVEYWNGSRFIANPDDSQTDVKGITAAETHIWPTGNDAAPKAVTLGAGGKVSDGYSRTVTAKEAESYRQQTRVWLDLDASANGLPWLKYNWNKDNAGEENPSSVVTFGIHRGNDRVIYRGEPGLTGQ
ncbi:conserved exported hypothetical protein [Vibrio jasicida]|uniref:DUF6701 domain-containing protein n=1 Tax=Vibrio jasicida TaxID=766224 RepID=A0AAU9QMS8_9VIBR|nr:conserved exported hypothetical protein [Vibrio jasicida]CAH1590923.1 conserved exported hypothetical protein [Vibrio jasicida]